MPLVYQQNINLSTQLGVWHIAETADFFLQQVPAQRHISHPHKQLQHLAGRMLLKELHPDFPYELMAVAETRKPFLVNEAYHFSISHCGDYAAAIISNRLQVGIDIETITPKTQQIQHKFLTEGERQILQDLDPTLPDQTRFTLAWSIKESLFKWYGAGGIDFKAHLRILSIQWKDHEGTAQCQFQKGDPVKLKVQFLIFGQHCIAWVLNP